MVKRKKLILIGYWDGEATSPGWPSVHDFVDPNWDVDERLLVAEYLQTGLIARAYAGYSRCRFCGCNNGALELSDGYFVWPDGLSHYVAMHNVRLPERFVIHVIEMTDHLEAIERDDAWWRQTSLAQRSTRPV